MRRRSMLLARAGGIATAGTASLWLAACRPAVEAPAPSPPPSPRSDRPVASDPRPTASPALAPAATPVAVHAERGWVRRPDDPSAPTVQLFRLDHRGDSGRAAAEAIVAAMDPILACWEAMAPGEPEGWADVSIDVRSEGTDPEPLRIATSPEAASDLQPCVHAAVRPGIAPLEPDAWTHVQLRLFARYDAALLPTARDDRIVSVRDAGTCWQWQEYPCAPHKHCMAPEWVRTTCGDPTLRSDVEVALGLGPPDADGRLAPVDVRLLSAEGDVRWKTDLPADWAARYGAVFLPERAPAVVVGRDVRPWHFAWSAATFVIADAAGILVLDRRTGAIRTSWVAPPSTEPTLWYDRADVVARHGQRTCSSQTPGVTFFVLCDDLRLWFDGRRLAVFDADTLRLLGTVAIGDPGARTSHAVAPSVTFRVAGIRVQIVGTIFLQ